MKCQGLIFSFKCFSFLRSPKKCMWCWRNSQLTCTRKIKERGKKIPTSTKKSSQVLSCSYEKLFPSACQLHSLSLLFGKFRVWFWLVGVFFPISYDVIKYWVWFTEYIYWSGVPLSGVTWDTSCVAAVFSFQCHTDQPVISPWAASAGWG